MRTIVCKFGGSSTANATQFSRILAILRASPARRCVVLSAPGTDERHDVKITRLLSDCWHWRNDPARRDALIVAIAARYTEIAAALGLPDMRALVRREVEAALSESRDATLSRGEYLCALLFSRYSGIPMIDAAEAITFDDYGDIDHRRTRERLSDAFSRAGGRAILPGFYGADSGGHIRALPLNGSDITGALAAAALNAGLYENWTDVPGLMTADPAIVPEARLIPQVGYRQMRMLARAGARVLHPACLDPVAEAGIPTRLRNANDPDSLGTLIDDNMEGMAPCIVGKRLPDGASVITVFGVDPGKTASAADALSPSAVSQEDGCCRITLPGGGLAPGMRHLHRRLIA